MGSALKQIWITLLVVAVPHVLSVEISARQACIDDFSPCVCSEQNGAITVDCNGVYGGEIRQAFSRATSTNHVDVLNIIVPDDCGIFPADMFSGKSVAKIYARGNSCRLYIDSNAFTSSSNRTEVFSASNFSLRLLDFAFLKGFSALSAIMFFSCSDMSALQHLPSLPTVAYFYSLGSVGSANMTDFPAGRSFSGLIQFMWAHGDLNDELAETICENIAQTTSVYTLNYFDLNSNRLTHIPTGLSHLQNNPTVLLQNNSITSLKTGSVLFHAGSAMQLSFDGNPITSIEPAAFVGDFSGTTKLNLTNHRMTRFPADVFLPVLEDMVHRGNGVIDIGNQPSTIICDCHLAWLIRDHRHLLDHVLRGYCEDGKSFLELDPYNYASC